MIFRACTNRFTAQRVIAPLLLFLLASSLVATPLRSQVDTAAAAYVQMRLGAADSDSRAVALVVPSRREGVRLETEPFLTLAAVIGERLRRVRRDEGREEIMDAQEAPYGHRNPDAPEELSGFDFLIGRWRCESKVKNPEGGHTTYRASWEGRYILDGYVIADEFRQFESDGNVIQLGRNYRAYDVERGAWAMKWLDALNGTWLDLGPEELGGVLVEDSSVVFKHHLPPGPAEELFPAHTIFRITFHKISRDGFSWRAEVSTDGEETWEQVQVIEARRVEE